MIGLFAQWAFWFFCIVYPYLTKLLHHLIKNGGLAWAVAQDKYKLDNYFSSESYSGGNEIFTNQNTIFHIIEKINELSLTVIKIVLFLVFCWVTTH